MSVNGTPWSIVCPSGVSTSLASLTSNAWITLVAFKGTPESSERCTFELRCADIDFTSPLGALIPEAIEHISLSVFLRGDLRYELVNEGHTAVTLSGHVDPLNPQPPPPPRTTRAQTRRSASLSTIADAPVTSPPVVQPVVKAARATVAKKASTKQVAAAANRGGPSLSKIPEDDNVTPPAAPRASKPHSTCAKKALTPRVSNSKKPDPVAAPKPPVDPAPAAPSVTHPAPSNNAITSTGNSDLVDDKKRADPEQPAKPSSEKPTSDVPSSLSAPPIKQTQTLDQQPPSASAQLGSLAPNTVKRKAKDAFPDSDVTSSSTTPLTVTGHPAADPVVPKRAKTSLTPAPPGIRQLGAVYCKDTPGSGAPITPEDHIRIYYVLKTLTPDNYFKLHSSVSTPSQPLELLVGDNTAVFGMSHLFVGMQPGCERLLFVPAALVPPAAVDQGVPANTILRLKVMLIGRVPSVSLE
ncbi:hypothetical protein ONZ45_g12050 [Pleurotus djamor]|nr:hypothetical protein ONZ45_g12050 [Pleurotus djamor]